MNELTKPSEINFIGNAGTAHIAGAELDAQLRPDKSWDLGGSLSFNDAELVSVNPAAIATKGDRLPGSAPLAVVAYSEYDHSIWNGVNFFGRFDLKWGGKEYSNLQNATSLTFGNTTDLKFAGRASMGSLFPVDLRQQCARRRRQDGGLRKPWAGRCDPPTADQLWADA